MADIGGGSETRAAEAGCRGQGLIILIVVKELVIEKWQRQYLYFYNFYSPPECITPKGISYILS